MKRLIICPILLAVILFICIFSLIVTDKRVNNMTQIAEQVKQAAIDENFEEAHNLYQELNSTWHESEKIFALYLRHNDYDSLVQSIAAMGGYVRFAEQPELVAECEAVIADLMHLNESQQITWENII